MNIEIGFEYPKNDWSVTNVFNGVYNDLLKTNLNLKYIDTSKLYNGNPGGTNSPHIMTLKNIDNGNYIVVSYWDRASDFTLSHNGWIVNNCKDILTSSGVFNGIKTTPISYLPYTTNFDRFSKNALKIQDKKINNLSFRGFLYGDRNNLFKLNRLNITNEKLLPDSNYFDELTNTKICLSLNGAAEVSHRDIEILSARSVLFRLKLNQNFHNELIPNYHYISFDYDSNPNKQCDIILDKFEHIKNNIDLLEYVSENGYKWYQENATIKSNIDIIYNVININLLK